MTIPNAGAFDVPKGETPVPNPDVELVLLPNRDVDCPKREVLLLNKDEVVPKAELGEPPNALVVGMPNVG